MAAEASSSPATGEAEAKRSSSALKVAALCGSLRRGSFNRGLLRAAVEICEGSIDGLEIEVVEIAPLPFVNTDLEVAGAYPTAVEEFRAKILAADCVLFASPEYNYSISAHSAIHHTYRGTEMPLVIRIRSVRPFNLRCFTLS